MLIKNQTVIPPELAFRQGNRFYLAKSQYGSDFDGPWPLLAFLSDPDREDVITFHICTLDSNLIDILEKQRKSPLEQLRGQYLNMSRQAVIGLVQLLSSAADSMIQRESRRRTR